MEFEVDRDDLYACLAKMSCVRGTDWVGMVGSKAGLTLRAGDSTAYVSASMLANTVSDIVVLVNRKLLTTCIATLKTGPVQIRVTKKRLHVQQGTRQRHIAIGDTDLLPVEPKVGDRLQVTYSAKDLLQRMRHVKFALAQSGAGAISYSQQALTGYYFDSGRNLIFAADGVRLAYIPLPGPIPESFLVSPECESVLAQMTGDITIRCTPPGWIELASDNTTAKVATIGQDYPVAAIGSVCGLVDLPGGTTLTAKKKQLMPFLRMALGYAELAKQEQTSSMLTLFVDPNEQAVTFNMDVSSGSMEDTLRVACLGTTPVAVGLNPIYFNQAIQASGELVNVTVRSSHEPVIVQSDDLTIIQMVMGGAEVAQKYRATREEEAEEEDDGNDF